jgi:hypothetical protein
MKWPLNSEREFDRVWTLLNYLLPFTKNGCAQMKRDSSLLDVRHFLHIILNYKIASWLVSSVHVLHPAKYVHILEASSFLGKCPCTVPGTMSLNLIFESAEWIWWRWSDFLSQWDDHLIVLKKFLDRVVSNETLADGNSFMSMKLGRPLGSE